MFTVHSVHLLNIPKDNKTCADWVLTDFTPCKCQLVFAEGGDKGPVFKTQSKSSILGSILIFKHKEQQIFTRVTLLSV